jgi:hypothetical protein
MIGLTNQLYAYVFDAVMNHFNNMSGAVLSDPITTRLAVCFGCNLLEYSFDVRPERENNTK